MGLLTRVYHSAYPLTRDVITECTRRATCFHRFLCSRRHEVAMNRDARGHFYVGIGIGDERSSFVEFTACTCGDIIEHIGDAEQTKVEGGRCDSQGTLLLSQTF